MPAPRAVIFDADGVLIIPPELFSRRYARESGVSVAALDAFLAGDFVRALRGETDLLALMQARPDLWGPDPLAIVQRWFEAENYPNQPLIELISRLRSAGLPVYLATNQEPRRAAYLRTVMFPGLFDHTFISCELGCTKSSAEYWQYVLAKSHQDLPHLTPAEVLFFDDSPRHLAPAIQAGINGQLYRSPAQVMAQFEPQLAG